MLKLIGTAYRRPDLTPEQFLRYWHEVHAPISASPPGLRGYVVSEVVSRLAGDLEADAFVEQWWDDEAAFRAAGQTPEAAAAWADVANYARTDGTFWLSQEESYISPVYPDAGLLRGGAGGVPGGVKMIGSARRRDDFTTAAFFEYWRTVHAPLGGKTPGLSAYVVTRLGERIAGDVSCDAFISLWYPDQAAFEAAGASPEQAVAWADVANYARTDGTFWLCREHVFIAPPALGWGVLVRFCRPSPPTCWPRPTGVSAACSTSR
jgi:uncharacterized protein (TIGR02118 family)